jgi:hypothetical protein
MNRREALQKVSYGTIIAATMRFTRAAVSKLKPKPKSESLREDRIRVANAATLVRLAELLLLCSYDKSRILKGCVVWDSHPPRGVSECHHKHSLLDAVDTGLRFCGEESEDECWIVAGSDAITYFARLPHYQLQRPRSAFCNFLPAGRVRRALLIEGLDLFRDRFYVGTRNALCLGRIIYSTPQGWA